MGTKYNRTGAVGFVLTMLGLAFPGIPEAASAWKVIEDQVIARVWSGHPVGFYLLTVGSRQYVVYYDAERTMTVAALLALPL